METEDEVETFKDLVSKISTDIFKKATEKAVIIFIVLDSSF